MVSEDHYISRYPGRLYHTKVKLATSRIFSGGCLFVDHTSEYMRINNKVNINTTETIKENSTLRGRIKVREW